MVRGLKVHQTQNKARVYVCMHACTITVVVLVCQTVPTDLGGLWHYPHN